MKVIDITGRRFGELLVIQRSSERGNKGQIKWECICDCGNTHRVTGESLRSGKSKSCGCRRHTPPNKEKDRVLAVWKQLYKSTIEKRSKKFGIPSDMSLDDFIFISKKPCFYCGDKDSNFSTDRNSSGKKTSETVVRYNGLDRLDSSGGYTKNNSVPCCKHCNIAKNTMSQQEFMDFIKRVYEYNN